MFLIYDTETTGLPKNYNAPLTDFDNWPRLVQLAWQIHDEKGELVDVKNFIVKPDGFVIPRGAEKVHGITTEYALQEGEPLSFVLEEFNKVLQEVAVIVGHNIEFDNNIMGAEFLRTALETNLFHVNSVDTKDTSTDYCAIPGGKGGGYKWPTLDELHTKLFNESFEAAHNASADVQATARCFLELLRIGVIEASQLKITPSLVSEFRDHNPDAFKSIGLNVEPYHQVGEEIPEIEKEKPETIEELKDAAFTHLHSHTQYSVLDGLSNIERLVEKAKGDGMKALAITDHGNMFGVKHFHEAITFAGLKPILGCEVYIARRGMSQKKTKIDGSGWHLILLAKNEKGYKNLMKLVSAGWIDGYYYKPRIDKELLKKHSEGLIALTACLGGEIPDKIMQAGEEKAEEALLEYKDIFGEDLYLELQKHPTGDPEMDRKVFDDQVYVNKVLIEFGQKHGLKVVATNDAHFIEKDDASAHDRLICIGTASDLDDPRRLRYTRQEWFKTQDEMKSLFADIPDAIINTQEVVDKVEYYELNHEPIMPEFTIP
jgi:DNA polymerase-3 subunit alpha